MCIRCHQIILKLYKWLYFFSPTTSDSSESVWKRYSYNKLIYKYIFLVVESLPVFLLRVSFLSLFIKHQVLYIVFTLFISYSLKRYLGNQSVADATTNRSASHVLCPYMARAGENLIGGDTGNLDESILPNRGVSI